MQKNMDMATHNGLSCSFIPDSAYFWSDLGWSSHMSEENFVLGSLCKETILLHLQPTTIYLYLTIHMGGIHSGFGINKLDVAFSHTL